MTLPLVPDHIIMRNNTMIDNFAVHMANRVTPYVQGLKKNGRETKPL